MIKKILNSLQRITTSTRFIPEVDGLRFVAIFSVLLYHINGFIFEKNNNIYNVDNSKALISNILGRGHLGVELFFVISGFILSFPFASHYINKTQLPPIKQYFVRRLTRLEPPYILSMAILFGAMVFMGKYTINELLPSLLASLSYTHNIFYQGELPRLNAVAWSLEVEVQFYILAPLFARIFILSPFKRRSIIISSIVIITVIQCLSLNTLMLQHSILNYIQYFGVGFILADIKLTSNSNKNFKKNISTLLLGIASFCLIWLCDTKGLTNTSLSLIITLKLLLLIFIFIFYYLVLFTPLWKRVFSIQIFTVVGGMCYSIYLLHYPIISLLGNPVVNRVSVSRYYAIDFLFYTILLLIPVLFISTIFFKIIEQPCMKRDWHTILYEKVVSKIKTIFSLA